MSESSASDASRAPALRVVRGEPTPEDLAVITALVTAAAASAAGGASDERPARGHWTDPRMLVRRQLHPGPGAWQAAVR